MAEIDDLDTTDASNTDRFPENQAPSTVNNGARALEGIIARWHEDIGGRKSSTGSANAYVFAAAQTLSAYYDGLVIGFDANFQNSGAATLNVDAIGAKNILKNGDTALVSGDIKSGQKVLVIYDGAAFQMISSIGNTSGAGGFESGTKVLFPQTAAPTGWTKLTTHNDKSLRVVSGTASTGGATAFTNVFNSGKTTASHVLTIAEMPAHTHTLRQPKGAPDGSDANIMDDDGTSEISGSTGGGGGHTHTLSLDLQYVDVIMASKD